jgi:hypothetical protein
MEPVPQSINALPLEIRMERLSQCTDIFDLFHPSLENAAAFLAVLARFCKSLARPRQF